MAVFSVGRNDPCPCGSGRKFKHCCLNNPAGNDDFLGSEGPLSAFFQDIHAQDFQSMDEAQAFIASQIVEQDHQAIDDFHGLSPAQMHQVLNYPFDSPGIVWSPNERPPQASAPILSLFRLLEDALGGDGLKATATGNLPRNFCREAALAYWGEEKYQEETRIGGINSELDFHSLHVTRVVAELAGLVRKYKGRFILSRDCRGLMEKSDMAEVYRRLFRCYVEKFNWAYQDIFDELPFIQRAFLFTLYLLTRYGDVKRSQAFYEDAFLGAFPMLMDEVPERPYRNPEQHVRDCYMRRTLMDFCAFFGLASVEPVTDDILCSNYWVTAQPLLREVVAFQALR